MSDCKADVLSWTARMDGESFDIVSLEIKQGKEMIQRNLLIHDFIAALNNAAASDSLLRIGKLPHGYFDGGVDPKSLDTFQCMLVVPAGKRIVQYYDSAYEVPYPAMVFLFVSKNGYLTKSNVFFVETDAPDEKTTLYQYCFANVSSFDGQICWGSNHLPELNEMKDCDKLVALFFGSPCNDDYYSYTRFASGAPEYCKSQRALYEHLKDCEVFPFEILAATKLKVADLWNE